MHGGGIRPKPCAYLHNYEPDGVIDDAFYARYVERAPLFLRGDAERDKLRAFIRRWVRTGDRGETIWRIEGGRIRPSKMLADSLVQMLDGKEEFFLIDDQKLVFETALAAARNAESGRKQVLIVEGGPGTGKTVLAIRTPRDPDAGWFGVPVRLQERRAARRLRSEAHRADDGDAHPQPLLGIGRVHEGQARTAGTS